jgi:DNA primase
VSQYKYDASNLPMPSVVLEKLGIKPLKKNRQGYLVLRCPFHKNGQERHSSFNLHSVNGHYRCHACGVKGGSIIHFCMRVKNHDFEVVINYLKGI